MAADLVSRRVAVIASNGVATAAAKAATTTIPIVFFAVAPDPVQSGVNIPRQSRGLYVRSRSKRLVGVADAAPIERREPLKAADGVADATPVSVGHLKVAA